LEGLPLKPQSRLFCKKIREKEKEAVISDFRLKIGTIINGMVLRFAGPNIIIDVGKTEAIMPPEEQIHNEKYHLNQRLVVFVVEIKEGIKGEEVVVSRANKGFWKGFLSVKFPKLRKEPLKLRQLKENRETEAKLRFFSNQSGIDPLEAVLGKKELGFRQ